MTVKLNWKNFFKELIPIAVAYAANKAGPEYEAVLEGLNALGFEIKQENVRDWLERRGWLDRLPINLEAPNNEERLNRLIQAALVQGLTDLTSSAIDVLQLSPDSLLAAMQPSETNLPSVSLDDRMEFLGNPTKLEGYQQFRTALAQWFETSLGLSDTVAKTVAERLDGYFVKGLFDEWDTAKEMYEPLETLLNNPFSELENTRRAWLKYRARLQASLDEHVLDEPFSTRQIYTPLRAYWIVSIPLKEETETKHLKFKQVVPIETTLAEWATNQDGSLRVLSAGPGAGKSTVARIFAEKQAREHPRPVLFVPLKDFSINEGASKALEDFLEGMEGPGIKISSTEFLNAKPLLIFDGMDELAIQHASLKDKLEQFIKDVERWIEKHHVHVLLTGREFLLQSQTSLQRDHEQDIWHLMPYWQQIAQNEIVPLYDFKILKDGEKTTNRFATNAFVENDMLDRDSRGSWWGKYTQLTGRTIQALPEAISELEQLEDISSQPLLSLLLAQAYFDKLDQGNPIDANTNLNDIYDQLIQRVIRRNRAKKLSYEPTVNPVEYELFLECCAMACWHNSRGGRIADLPGIRNQLETYNAEHLLGANGEQRGVWPKLLTNFYFRNPGGQYEHSKVEFTHKSFGEYLVARRLTKLIDGLVWSETSTRTKEEAFKQWFQATMNNPVDIDLLRFLNAEAQRTKAKDDQADDDQAKTKKARANQDKLAGMLKVLVLNNGVPYELKDLSAKPFHELHQGMINAEEALLGLHAAYSQATGFRSNLEISDDWLLRGWLDRVCGSQIGEVVGLGLKSVVLNNTIFYRMDLDGTDLTEAHLNGADLTEAHLNGADLTEAHLNGADLTKAHLIKTILNGADLTDAHLIKADLTDAHLIGATLNRAILTGATLIKADLNRATLNGAILNSANLTEANLTEADLIGGNLIGAHLVRAHLARADLTNADFTDANLIDADLTEANLTGAKFKNTYIRRFFDLKNTKTTTLQRDSMIETG
jgi:uncharacterized protein YjbI with pentapeptide repeats